jgi:ribonucleotide reductase alpha subunit
MSGNCSSGIEPMFAYAYKRNFWQGNERKSELVFHPLFIEFMKDNKDVSHFVASQELKVEEHMEIQSIIQKHIDNAVSKTINMAEDYPMDDMAKTWLKYMPLLKGTTFYRENARKFVGKDDSDGEPPLNPLSLEEAKRQFYETNPEYLILHEEREQKCKGGMCEL